MQEVEPFKNKNDSQCTHMEMCGCLLQKCVAKALYDNIAESPDELAFRRGDLLTVLEQNTAGIEGWWLCSLRGRQVLRKQTKKTAA